MQPRLSFRPGQATVDYIIITVVALLVGLLAAGLLGFIPNTGLDISAKNAQDFWRDQARPFTVAESVYRTNVSRLYLALELQPLDTFNLTGVFLNNTQVAFWDYSETAADNIGALRCGASACQAGPCTCDRPVRPLNTLRIATEAYSDGLTLCGPNARKGELQLAMVYFRPLEKNRNLTETGFLALPFACQ